MLPAGIEAATPMLHVAKPVQSLNKEGATDPHESGINVNDN
jgi:hypothetical protein